MKEIVVAGIGTGVGKTVVSAIVVKALRGNYWKPVQCGDLENSDSQKIQQLVGHNTICYPETYRLKYAQSPHIAAQLENSSIHFNAFQPPNSDRPLIVECAGGLHVPLNEHFLQIDLLSAWKFPCILVSKHYLGSINHTLLALEALRHRQIPVYGVIFNGEFSESIEKVILAHGQTSCLGSLHNEPIINISTINKYANLWEKALTPLLLNS